MKLLKDSLLKSSAAIVLTAWAQASAAADLPTNKSAAIDYVRACGAYKAGFFYIPGTDTCLRISGRARFEYGYQAPLARSPGNGDYSGFRGLLRMNVDARTQTDYGTLRAFLRIEAASRTGFPTMHSGPQLRIANAFPATGQDTFGRVQDYIATDKAFIQFAGLTAGRASSFFDFYAHDFEIQGGTLGSDAYATNLLAYTKTFEEGYSPTLSMEDPNYRRSPLYSASAVTSQTINGGPQTAFAIPTNAPAPFFAGFSATGLPTGVAFTDVVQRSRLPDFVGAFRVDQPWGSFQLSAAVHEVNTGGAISGAFIGTNNGTPLSNTNVRATPSTPSEYGWAVQGGVKVNLPQIAPGDAFYLQGAYGEGAAIYTGLAAYAGLYAQSTSAILGAPFVQYFNDATLNPLTNKLELSNSFSVVAAYLHYWTPEWRSAIFGSYGQMNFAPGARAAQASVFPLTGNGPGPFGSTYYQLNQILRDTYAFNVGGSLIWSPVKDLDIGIEGVYQNYGVQSGRVLDLNKNPLQTAAYVNNPANLSNLRTVTSADVFQVRARVQRDF